MLRTILVPLITSVLVGVGGYEVVVAARGSDSPDSTENGAVVEPIYGSPSPEPTEEAPAMQGGMRQQQTQEPTTIIVVPRHTASPTPFDEPTDTPELDEETHDEPTDEPTPEEFGEGEGN